MLCVVAGLIGLIGLVAGCETKPDLIFQNRADTLISLRVTAGPGREIEILHKDTERERRAGQQRFVDRPAAELLGLSSDRNTFGPVRVNPREIVRFRLVDMENETPSAGAPVLQFEAASLLAIDDTDRARLPVYLPLPELVAVREIDGSLRFELPVGYRAGTGMAPASPDTPAGPLAGDPPEGDAAVGNPAR
ncbi:MAG: hypothetical protein AAF108_01505 [Planctomycetota bacterium]